MNSHPLSANHARRVDRGAVLFWLAVISPLVMLVLILLAEAFGWR
jgi:hypothetical protein